MREAGSAQPILPGHVSRQEPLEHRRRERGGYPGPTLHARFCPNGTLGIVVGRIAQAGLSGWDPLAYRLGP
jgi:hypothetical protein